MIEQRDIIRGHFGTINLYTQHGSSFLGHLDEVSPLTNRWEGHTWRDLHSAFRTWTNRTDILCRSCLLVWPCWTLTLGLGVIDTPLTF